MVPPPERPRRSPSSLSLEDSWSCSRCWACVHERAGIFQLPAGTPPKGHVEREGYEPHQVMDRILVKRLVEEGVGHAGVKSVLKNGIDSSSLTRHSSYSKRITHLQRREVRSGDMENHSIRMMRLPLLDIGPMQEASMGTLRFAHALPLAGVIHPPTLPDPPRILVLRRKSDGQRASTPCLDRQGLDGTPHLRSSKPRHPSHGPPQLHSRKLSRLSLQLTVQRLPYRPTTSPIR